MAASLQQGTQLMPHRSIVFSSVRLFLLMSLVACCCAGTSSGQTTNGDKTIQKSPSETARTIRVAGVIFDHVQQGDYRQANFQQAEKLIRESAAAGAKIVCTVEQFLDGYGFDANKMQGAADSNAERCEVIGQSVYVQRLSELARELNVVIVAGVALKEGTKTFNSALIFELDGNLAGTYRKTHNAGKYARWFAPLSVEEKQAACPSFPIGGGRLSVKICNDRRFPETTRYMVDNGCELLLCPAYGSYTPGKLVDDSAKYGLWAVFVHPQGCQFIDRGQVVVERRRKPGESLFVMHEVEFRSPRRLADEAASSP